MSSIAMFPCQFTPVAAVVGELANSLGLQVYTDEQLIDETNTTYYIPPATIKQMIYARTSVFNQFTLERERTVNRLRAMLVQKLQSPNKYLFYGFSGLLISPQITHVLKVLVVDDRQSRIERAVSEGISSKEAKRRVRNFDIQAYSWTDFLFQKEAYDKSLYDLVIPVQGRSSNEISEEIIRRYHTTSVLRTAASQKAIQDMECSVTVEGALLENGHKVDVIADNGIVTLVVHKSVFNFSKLTDELTELARDAADVKEVKVLRASDYDVSIYRKQKFELPSKVLFVDDEKEFVQTVSQRLISRDVGTYGVFSGEEALDLIHEDRPDVMVLDLKMPGLHGVEVLRRTKDIAPEVEVIILTGHGTSEDMEQCMKLGAFAYMNKPVDIEELSGTIIKAHEQIKQRVPA